MYDADEEWARIEALASDRPPIDDDAHVDAYARFTHACTLHLALRFSEVAREEYEAAELALNAALERAQRAVAHLNRTSDLLADVVRLSTMGRS